MWDAAPSTKQGRVCFNLLFLSLACIASAFLAYELTARSMGRWVSNTQQPVIAEGGSTLLGSGHPETPEQQFVRQQQQQIQQLQKQLEVLQQQPASARPLPSGMPRLAQEWARDPYSFCFQGAGDPRKTDLTIVTVTSIHLQDEILACIRMNRLLAAMEHGARYCHFYTMDPTRAIHWSKILALKQALMVSKHVLWLDSDAIITRFDIPLLPYFLNLTAGKDAVFSSEFDQSLYTRDQLLEQRQDTLRLNTGVIFLRSTNWTITLLDLVYKDSPPTSHWGDPFHDQHGFTHFQRNHRQEWKDHVHVVHYKYMNHWERTYKNGSLIFHSAGGAHKRQKYPNSVFPKCQESNAKSRFSRRLRRPVFRGIGGLFGQSALS